MPEWRKASFGGKKVSYGKKTNLTILEQRQSLPIYKLRNELVKVRTTQLLVFFRSELICVQGSYGSWKTWKVMEFQHSKIQAWKSWKINFSHGKSWEIEVLHNINEVFYLFQFTSHNNNMNCCYITDFCKSEVNFVLLLYLLSLEY